MTLDASDIERLLGHALDAAREAGRLVAESRPSSVELKPGDGSLASRMLTEVDRRSEQTILGILAPTLERYDLAMLSEEQPDDGERHRRDYFWCADPLDGTLPFVEGTAGYSVSIALVSREGVPVLGVVFDPVDRVLYHAIRGRGLYLDGRPWTPAASRGDVLSLFSDRSFRNDPRFDLITGALRRELPALGLRGLELDTTGAAVMNACRVLHHPPACSFKLPKPQDGGGSLWDYAAVACLLHEAGAIASDIHGDPLDLNRRGSTFMSHRGVLFATNAMIARSVRSLRHIFG